MKPDNVKPLISGHVLIKDDVGNILLNKNNAIHTRNMALAISRGLAGDTQGNVYRIKLGNGGTSVTSSGLVQFQPPISFGNNSTLYNQIYEEDFSGSNTITVEQSNFPEETCSIICTAIVAANEPADQALTDGENSIIFDELGLFTDDNLMLSHIIFSPISKTQNRELIITYTLTISIS